jgi:hypothetical protein
VSYDEVLEDKYIRVTVLYVVVYFVMWLYFLLCGCIIMLFLLLCYVFFVSLNIPVVMYVPFCVNVLFFVLFVCECVLDNCHQDVGALFDYSN